MVRLLSSFRKPSAEGCCNAECFYRMENLLSYSLCPQFVPRARVARVPDSRRNWWVLGIPFYWFPTFFNEISVACPRRCLASRLFDRHRFLRCTPLMTGIFPSFRGENWSLVVFHSILYTMFEQMLNKYPPQTFHIFLHWNPKPWQMKKCNCVHSM